MIKLNILIAYPYFVKGNYVDHVRAIDRNKFNLIIDSGAFSAWNSGHVIKLQDYCNFLDSIKDLRPFHAVQLDVFGNAEKSWVNYLKMKDMGYESMPVFTRGETLEKLDKMYEETDYIMFGGITIGGKNRNYIKWFMERNQQRKGHWLGFTNLDFIRHYRPTSVDSSSWNVGASYGILTLLTNNLKFKRIRKIKLNRTNINELYNSCDTMGFSKREFMTLLDKRTWVSSFKIDINSDLSIPTKTFATFVTVCSYVKQAILVEKKYGTKMYFACGSKVQLDIVFQAYQYLQNKGCI